MKLYVANMTKQFHDFLYTVPEEKKQGRFRMQRIAPGEQIRVYQDDMTQADVDAIVSQHEIYGLIGVNEIKRTKAFIGLCFSVDKPVDMEKFMVAEQHNDAVLADRGVEIRKNAAVAVADHISRNRESSGDLAGLDVEVIEQPKRGGTPDGLMNEKVTVSNNDQRSKNRRRT